MDEKKKCLCSSGDTKIVACSGASNVGQMANQAAIDLAKEKVGDFFCLAGVGAHIKGMIKSGKEADLVIALDGCAVQCATKTLQHAGIEPAIQVIVTELGVEKSHDIAVDQEASSKIIRKVKEEMGHA
ncbi:MAG: DGC domain protein [Methanosaeta sp. PtaU1.Bin060]|jgi:uncharacterized metal-binding protein|nr:MAG: DGC domain protein [Methanosaeta sp. PtaU1.Bin060]